MKTLYNRNAIAELIERGYHNRHIAIVMGSCEDAIVKAKKTMQNVEPTLQFLTHTQKQRLLVLDRLLELKKPIEVKWGSNDYYYITILKFLLVPRTTIVNIYKHAPQAQVARAYKKSAPMFSSFDYTLLGVNSEEWFEFVAACYKIIGDSTKWE